MGSENNRVCLAGMVEQAAWRNILCSTIYHHIQHPVVFCGANQSGETGYYPGI
jgi:hypothetical protein